MPPVLGQERNFDVMPSVSCEELGLSFGSLSEALTQITQSEYRITATFTIRRKKGLKAGSFYSCDAINGYLILQIDDNQIVYFEVPKSVWEDLIQSNDPDYYIQTKIKPIYSRMEWHQMSIRFS